MACHRDGFTSNQPKQTQTLSYHPNTNTVSKERIPSEPSSTAAFRQPSVPSRIPEVMVTAKKIFFIKPRQESTRLNDACKCLSKENFLPVWIKETEIDSLKHLFKLNIYIVVMDIFEGEAFERLKDEENILLLSAYALIAISPKTGSDIPFQKYPLESLCMDGLHIFLSGFPKQSTERREIKKKIRRMGGEVTRKVREKSTQFIVATSWTTGLSNLARKNPEKISAIPIMSNEWINFCYNQRENIGNRGAQLEKIVKKFSLKVFAGMCITPTGFDSKEKEKIGNIVTQKGGKYAGDLVLPRSNRNITPTTHLIVKKPVGLKYEEALKHPNIYLVNLEWLTESCRRSPQYPHLEEEFSVRPKDSPNRSTRDFNHELNQYERAHAPSVETNNEDLLTHISSAVSGIFSHTSDETYELLQKVLSDKQTKDSLFEGLTFYFCGVPTRHQCLAKNLIRRCGGTVYDDLTCVVTHIILGLGFNKKDAEMIKKHEEKNHSLFSKVSIRWITDCWAGSQQLPESYDDLSEEQKKLVENSSCFENNRDEHRAIHKRGLEGDFVQAVKKLSTRDGNLRPQARSGFTFGAIPCSPMKKIRIGDKNKDSTPGSSIPVLWGTNETSSRRLS